MEFKYLQKFEQKFVIENFLVKYTKHSIYYRFFEEITFSLHLLSYFEYFRNDIIKLCTPSSVTLFLGDELHNIYDMHFLKADF